MSTPRANKTALPARPQPEPSKEPITEPGRRPAEDPPDSGPLVPEQPDSPAPAREPPTNPGNSPAEEPPEPPNVARARRREEQARDGAKAWLEHQASARATEEKTSRLRSLRLAREAAESARTPGQRSDAPR
jgi:hypothetical protein